MRLLKIASPPLYRWLISYQYKTTPKIVSNSVSTQGVSWASLWWLDQGRLLTWQQIKLRILVPSKSWSLKPSPLRISGITIVALLNGSPKQLLASLFGRTLPGSWHPFKAQWMGFPVTFTALVYDVPRRRNTSSKMHEFQTPFSQSAINCASPLFPWTVTYRYSPSCNLPY